MAGKRRGNANLKRQAGFPGHSPRGRGRVISRVHQGAHLRLRGFEEALSVPIEDIEFELRSIPSIPWAEFLINPRRLRGSDFLMRWSQGQWSEKRILQALEESGEYFGIPYGPSGTAPEGDIRAFEQYFEELDRAGLGNLKRPDILVFRDRHRGMIERTIRSIGGYQRLPFIPESEAAIAGVLERAVLALESENSLWVARQMPAYGRQLTPQRRLGGRPGMPKTAVLPTIIIKEEDRIPLRRWQRASRIPVHVWHIFYDVGYGIPFDDAEQLIGSGAIGPTEQTFQAPNGITTTKTTYRIYYQHGYPVGTSRQETQLVAAHIVDRNGHVLPYVRFEGGAMGLAAEALEVLNDAAQRK